MASAQLQIGPPCLADAYLAVRSLTEELAAPLSAEDQTVQSMPDVSPTKWHRAHTAWFFETFVLRPSLAGYLEFHPAYGFLFNSYYEAVGSRYPRAERGNVSRPGVADIAAYRGHVDKAMAEVLATELAGDVAGLVELGLHHEQQHQELLLMDVKHVLSKSPLRSAYLDPSPTAGVRPDTSVAPPVEGRLPTALTLPAWPGPAGTGSPPALGWIEHRGATVHIGHDASGFAFDNETPRHRVALEPFALADRLVTCGEWEEFIDDGGYHRAELWLSEGWATVTAERWSAPLYWGERDGAGRRRVFTLCGERPLDPSEPVCHVSYFEADAFARWARARLPTEAEWEAVAATASLHPSTGPSAARYGLHPDSAGRSLGLFGEVWQWTQSAYSPYPGFRPGPGAVGEYNGKFMVNQQVLRGSCCLTPPGHARVTYRNFFPASARWACSGARLARDL